METIVATRLRRSTRDHDAYTVRVGTRRVAALSTAHAGDVRRWIYTSRCLHRFILWSGRTSPLVVGLGVQWTPRKRHQKYPPRPATLQLCVGHRCLVFHLARADVVPASLYRFLADPRVLFVGSGSAFDRRMLWEHYGMDVASGCELLAVAGMGNASMERMAERFLGYTGITKPRSVAMSAWHARRLSAEQVEYACVDAYIAFRLGIVLCSGNHRATPQQHRATPLPTASPPAPRVEVSPPASHTVPRPRAPVVVHCPLPPGPRVVVLTATDDCFSSEGFEVVGYGSSATDHDDIGIDEYVAGTGLLSDDDEDYYVVAPDGYEEEDCYTNIGILSGADDDSFGVGMHDLV